MNKAFSQSNPAYLVSNNTGNTTMKALLLTIFVAFSANVVANEVKDKEKTLDVKKNVTIDFDVLGGVAIQNVGDGNCTSVSSIDSSTIGGNVKIKTNVKGVISITNVGNSNGVSVASIGGNSSCK